MKSIASQIGKRSTEFLLLATKDYLQLMLVNVRKNLDERMNLKCSIRKLLIDRTNPTAYDLDRLEAIAINGQSPPQLYDTQCEAFDVEKLTKTFQYLRQNKEGKLNLKARELLSETRLTNKIIRFFKSSYLIFLHC